MKDSVVEFVVVKNPRKPIVKHRKDGSVVIRIEMTQEQMDDTMSQIVEEQKKKEASE